MEDRLKIARRILALARTLVASVGSLGEEILEFTGSVEIDIEDFFKMAGLAPKTHASVKPTARQLDKAASRTTFTKSHADFRLDSGNTNGIPPSDSNSHPYCLNNLEKGHYREYKSLGEYRTPSMTTVECNEYYVKQRPYMPDDIEKYFRNMTSIRQVLKVRRFDHASDYGFYSISGHAADDWVANLMALSDEEAFSVVREIGPGTFDHLDVGMTTNAYGYKVPISVSNIYIVKRNLHVINQNGDEAILKGVRNDIFIKYYVKVGMLVVDTMKGLADVMLEAIRPTGVDMGRLPKKVNVPFIISFHADTEDIPRIRTRLNKQTVSVSIQEVGGDPSTRQSVDVPVRWAGFRDLNSLVIQPHLSAVHDPETFVNMDDRSEFYIDYGHAIEFYTKPRAQTEPAHTYRIWYTDDASMDPNADPSAMKTAPPADSWQTVVTPQWRGTKPQPPSPPTT